MSEDEYRDFLERGRRARAAIDGILAKPELHAARRRRSHPEDDTQRAVAQYWEHKYPATWQKTFHPPNGIAARNVKLAAIFAGLGVKSGVFDLICIARRGPFTGFALELKARHGSMSDGQNDWQTYFAQEGWYVALGFTLDTAIAAIDHYHSFAPPP